MELSNATLPQVPARVTVPSYDRSQLRTGIVHIGVGHFHRAHHALYLDDLFNRGDAHDWAVTGVGIIPDHTDIRDALAAQDGLYTLTEKTADGQWDSRVIGAIHRYHHAPGDPDVVIDRLADPATRIVSLTITEGGYDVDDLTGEFLGNSALVRADLAADRPLNSAFGLVLEAMRKRRAEGLGGVTIMSCDNVQGNGHVARAAFLGFAQAKEPEMAKWMEDHLTFPNSMVDRVTPRTVDADRQHLLDEYGLTDRWPVTAEPFRQWVLEDNFVAGRPPYEQAGVEVVPDVVPYELMKLRLANGTHQALCYFGTLLGHEYVHEAIADPDIQAMLLRYIDDEAIPTLTPIHGTDFHAYGRTVLERFGNPQIRDSLTRICEDTSDRIPKFLLPAAFTQLQHGRSVEVCAAVVASWARYAEGVGENGEQIDVRDPLREELMSRASEQHTDPLAFLRNRAIFGDLADQPAFVEPYLKALNAMHTGGARAALRQLR
ncbi:mannitol dehydrogenase family protein [Georgenia subflava]|uniref:Mannitol-1-phosphate 5-dehydrogenase n=1 Tax=Georgenia subflava TaxID=1622177 RepID=A0A6N7EKS4_9MICO|nr:mannitol dehydrogenase family protein [Georgenia subflava]MPV38031.1 mannitol dehydrogenase family protein [Georgenia subflava]